MQELLPANGRWRIVVFAGDISKPEQRKKLDHVGEVLGGKDSLLKRFTPSGARYDSVIETLAVHTAPRRETTIFDLPYVFRQYDEIDGWDYMKIYVDEESYHEGHGKIYETFGVSPQGCILIIRPDQYVSYVGPLEEPEAVDKFFSGFMLPQLNKAPGSKIAAPNGDAATGNVATGNAAYGNATNGSVTNGSVAELVAGDARPL